MKGKREAIWRLLTIKNSKIQRDVLTYICNIYQDIQSTFE